MKIVYYKCDKCGKEDADMAHFDLAGKSMDLCMVCAYRVTEAITAALEKIEK